MLLLKYFPWLTMIVVGGLTHWDPVNVRRAVKLLHIKVTITPAVVKCVVNYLTCLTLHTPSTTIKVI